MCGESPYGQVEQQSACGTTVKTQHKSLVDCSGQAESVCLKVVLILVVIQQVLSVKRFIRHCKALLLITTLCSFNVDVRFHFFASLLPRLMTKSLIWTQTKKSQQSEVIYFSFGLRNHAAITSRDQSSDWCIVGFNVPLDAL